MELSGFPTAASFIINLAEFCLQSPSNTRRLQGDDQQTDPRTNRCANSKSLASTLGPYQTASWQEPGFAFLIIASAARLIRHNPTRVSHVSRRGGWVCDKTSQQQSAHQIRALSGVIVPNTSKAVQDKGRRPCIYGEATATTSPDP